MVSSFLSDLWTSVFTPGTTPTLLIATNATFAALQLTLFALLVGTHSIHFVILSCLCGGLWWSVNWFAREVAIARDEDEKSARRRDQDDPTRSGHKGETHTGQERLGSDSRDGGTRSIGNPGEQGRSGTSSDKATEANGPTDGKGTAKRRTKRTKKMTESEISTDGEWVKLDSHAS